MYGAEAYGVEAYGSSEDAGALAPATLFDAQGWVVPSAFGTPGLRIVTEAIGFNPAATFPQPRYVLTPINTAALGFAPVNFGLVSHFAVESAVLIPAPHQTVSLRGPAFGTHRQYTGGVAVSKSSTTFGTPHATSFYVAAGFTSGAFGAPYAVPHYTARGFGVASLGTPTARAHYPASGLLRRPTRWGAPRSSQLFAPTIATASSWVAGMWGTPSCLTRMQRAVPLPPAYRFGRPLLVRTDTC